MNPPKISHGLPAWLVCVGMLLGSSDAFALSAEATRVKMAASETKIAADDAKNSADDLAAGTTKETAEKAEGKYEVLITKANALSQKTMELANSPTSNQDKQSLKADLLETYIAIEVAANDLNVIDSLFEDRLIDTLGLVVDALETILDSREKRLVNRRFLVASFRGHYRLERRVFAVSLKQSPAVRIQCQVLTERGSDTVVFDPQSSGAWTRYAILPKNDKIKSLTCVSDHVRSQAGTTGNDGGSSQFYEFTVVDGPTVPGSALKTVIGKWSSTSPGGPGANSDPKDLSVEVSHVPPLQGWTLLRQITSIHPTSTLRSLDPSTIAIDLITSLSTIAIERASEAAKDYVRTYLVQNLCTNLTVKKVREQLENSPISAGLADRPQDEVVLQATCGVLRSVRLDELASAKDILWKAIAIDASRLAVDAATSQIGQNDTSPERAALTAVLRAAHSVLTHSLSGDRAGTEREVQSMLLNLGSVGLGTKGETWACGLEAGVAVLRLCLRDNTCSADELDLLITQEDPGQIRSSSALSASEANKLLSGFLEAFWDWELAKKMKLAKESATTRVALASAFETLKASTSTQSAPCSLASAIGTWPALRPMLGRIGDVLQPPPGTPASTTTANALEVVVDVAQEIVKPGIGANLADAIKDFDTTSEDVQTWKALASLAETTFKGHPYASSTLNSLTKFIAVLRGEDPAAAIAEFGQALSITISRWCRSEHGDKKCTGAPVTSHQIRRAFTVLTAIGSYAASYREAKTEGETIDEKTRADERKKALESVIDAFTDRSNRTNEWVFSLGASVGFQLAGMHSFTGTVDSDGDRGGVLGNVFTLPMGVGVQRYPASSWPGVHGMVVLLDPAQYLTVNKLQDEAKFADPTPLTAVHLGLQAGLHFGSPNFPIVATVHAGWSPELRLFQPNEATDDDPDDGEWISHSAFTYGAKVGIYVPFFDFN